MLKRITQVGHPCILLIYEECNEKCIEDGDNLNVGIIKVENLLQRGIKYKACTQMMSCDIYISP